MTNLCRTFLLILGSLFFCSSIAAESVREFHQRKCAEGNMENCKKAEAMLEGERHADRIVELGDLFATKVNRSELEEENKPILIEAYFPILSDYFKEEAESGIRQTLTMDMLEICADHFHNHWRNRKMWWPTKDDGKPDWSTIYYYVVEHYYGYCLRSIQ